MYVISQEKEKIFRRRRRSCRPWGAACAAEQESERAFWRNGPPSSDPLGIDKVPGANLLPQGPENR